MPFSKFLDSAFLFRWRAIILFVLMLLSVNSAVFFGGRTLLPITSTLGICSPPCGYAGPSAAHMTAVDPWGALNVDYIYDVYTAQTVWHGSLPFWNPYQGLGQPFLANDLSAVFYPVNWLHLLLPYAWWDVVYVVNWWLAAVFLSTYLRLLGVAEAAALVGGAAILASGFFQCYLPSREISAVAAWWPLLLYGVERSLGEPGWRWRHVVLAGGVFCSVAGGQPEVTFLSLLAVTGYGVIRLVRQRPHIWRALWAIVPGTVTGLFLAAPAWLNFAQYAFSAYSVHQAGSTVGQMHLDFTTIAGYVFPYIYGRLHTFPFGLNVGWNWDLCPGWCPAIVLFLALVSLTTVIQKRQWELVCLWGVAGIIAAKIWGVPGVNALGRLPLFERVIYPRYAAFLLALSLAGLAAAGVNALTQFSASTWRFWLKTWTVSTITLLAMGIYPLWPTVRQSQFFSEPTLTVLVFGSLGLAWALAGPLGLWWLVRHRPQENHLLYFLATLGILLQGVAYAPNGYSSQTFAVLSASCLSLYVVMVLAISLGRKIQPGVLLVTGGCLGVALPSLLAAFLASRGLAARYNPLTPAPYLNRLIIAQSQNLYRSYSWEGVLPPNFAVPFAITSLGLIEPLLPPSSAAFMEQNLDRGALPIMFVGRISSARGTQFPSFKEFWHNKRYFDLVSVRYVLTYSSDPGFVLYDTETFGAKRDPTPLTKPLEMFITCPTDTLSNIQVLLSTYVRRNPGTVTLKIFSDDGTLLRQQDFEGAAVRDNSFQDFTFPLLQGMKGQKLRVRLEFVPAQPGSMLAAWTYPDQPALGFAVQVVEPRPELTLMYEDPTIGVRVWENHTAVPRVFLAPSARVAPSWQEAMSQLPHTPDLTRQVWIEQGPELLTIWPETQAPGELLGFELTPNTVAIRYQAKTAGILTLTDSYAEGWRVTVNGQEVPVLRVDGVFRGVRIEEPGIYEVQFWYRPPYWSLSLSMAIVGGLLLTAASWLGWRRSAR